VVVNSTVDELAAARRIDASRRVAASSRRTETIDDIDDEPIKLLVDFSDVRWEGGNALALTR
jgi:hypothetical protein